MVLDEIWRGLISNLAVVALFTSIWCQSLPWLDAKPRAMRKLLTGALVGTGATASMFLAVELQPGVFFDLRAAVIAVGAFFGGPIVGVVAALIGGLYRAGLGGQGAATGVVSVMAAAGVGLAVRTALGAPAPRRAAIVGLGLAVGGLTFIVPLLLPRAVAEFVFASVARPAAAMSFVATLMMGFALLQTRASARERFLLRTALAQAPDFQYVKNRDSAFIAVNRIVAEHNGFATPAEMVGKTDLDLFAEPHARKLMAQERNIVRTGVGIVDYEELLTDAEGADRWYRTSKAPLSDADGRVIGLAGVTVDITGQKRLERELEQSRNLVAMALSEMSDGLVLFDAELRIVFRNIQYLTMFGLTAEVHRPGAHLRDILHVMARVGEQVGIPTDFDVWFETVISELRIESEGEIELSNGRFLQRRHRPLPDGGVLVVFSDVTELKQAERALRAANAELSIQAATDGLTGLANRRSFDALLAKEVERSARDRSDISLLLIDADRFKAYNDRYGHQAGDDCLRMIAACLASVARRPADVAARYGGEEFALILPATDAAGAAFIGAALQQSLYLRASPHADCETGQVTVSIGLAHFGPDAAGRSAETLIGRADDALYLAKSAGRNRLAQWTPRLARSA